MKHLPPFIEKPALEHTNRDLARQAVVREAEMVDGSKGVTLMYGKFPIVFTNSEALTIATAMADQIERNRKTI